MECAVSTRFCVVIFRVQQAARIKRPCGDRAYIGEQPTGRRNKTKRRQMTSTRQLYGAAHAVGLCWFQCMGWVRLTRGGEEVDGHSRGESYIYTRERNHYGRGVKIELAVCCNWIGVMSRLNSYESVLLGRSTTEPRGSQSWERRQLACTIHCRAWLAITASRLALT